MEYCAYTTDTEMMTTEVEYKNSLVGKIFSLLTEREFRDMEIISDGHNYFCTKLILAAASPVFYNIIKAASGNCIENGVFKLDVDFISGKVIERMLKYYYTGQVSEKKHESDEEFFEAIKIFGKSDINIQTLDELRIHFRNKAVLSKTKTKQQVESKVLLSENDGSLDNEGEYLIELQADKSDDISGEKRARYTPNRLYLPRHPPFLCPCQNCGKIFETREKLRSHYRHNHGEKKYKCSECPQRFLYPKDLRSHTRTHTGEKPYVCEMCGKQFSRLSALNQHWFTHLRQKIDNTSMLFPCSSCKKRYFYQNNETNLLNHENFNASSLICPNSNCAKKFASTKCLRKHLKNRVCYVGQPKCAGCSKNFDSLLLLRRHVAEVHCTHKNKQRRVKFDQFLPENEDNENRNEDVSRLVVTNEIQCALCEGMFQEQQDYDKHITEHHENADVVPIETTKNVVSIEVENYMSSSEVDTNT